MQIKKWKQSAWETICHMHIFTFTLKRQLLCILISILQATFILSLGEGRKPHLPKMWEPSCRKNSSKTEQRTVMALEYIRRELATLLKPWLLFFNSILRQGLKLMPTNKNRPGPVFRMWARRQQSKRRNPAKFNLFNIHVWLFKNFLTPELYLQCRETARYQENLPPASLSMQLVNPTVTVTVPMASL